MSRKERRADPARWYAFDAYFDSRHPTAIGLGQHEQYVLGTIEDIVVVQMPEGLSDAERAGFLEGFRQVTALADHEFRYIVVPASVKLVRLRPVDPARAKDLDRQLRLRRVEAQVRAEKLAATEEKPKPS